MLQSLHALTCVQRGWTTWTVGAVDKRVVGIVPIVMDLLNLSPVSTAVGQAAHGVGAEGIWHCMWVGPPQNLHHFWRSLGGWTFAFKDYYEMNLTSEFDSEAFDAMHQVVDPYGELRHCASLDTALSTAACTCPTHLLPYLPTHLLPHVYTLQLPAAVYRDRLTMPKLIICTGGDEFFQPDDSIFYWSQLKEPKFIRWATVSSIQCASPPHKCPMPFPPAAGRYRTQSTAVPDTLPASSLMHVPFTPPYCW